MYEAFFELLRRPFAPGIEAGRYFPATAMEAARAKVARCVERGEGPALIIGPAGTGKSLLCVVLAAQLKERFTVALVANGRLATPRALLQSILFELGMTYRGLEEGELRLSLIDHLCRRDQSTAALALLVDEAHTLPWRLMDELRMMTNLSHAGQPRVRLVLAGSPLLEERFSSPKMDSFSQRLAARCYLESLSREETAQYVRAELAWAGGVGPTVMDDDSLDRVYQATDGVPRLVNQLCDHALVLANLAQVRPVTAAVVEEAWADLQQLPTPERRRDDARCGEGVIEFGGFDEGTGEDLASIPFPRASESPASIRAVESKLDQIEAAVSRLDDEFRPAGSIQPEVELVFDGAHDPFGESFDQEEVVLDRYAALDTGFWGGRPRVSSSESQQWSALLSQIAQVVVEPAAIDEGRSVLAVAFEDVTTAAKPDGAAVTVAAPWTPRESSAPAVATESAAVATPAPAMAIGLPDADEDSDQIVVEEEELPAAPLVRPAARVRREEYRQLFTRMRRG